MFLLFLVIFLKHLFKCWLARIRAMLTFCDYMIGRAISKAYRLCEIGLNHVVCRRVQLCVAFQNESKTPIQQHLINIYIYFFFRQTTHNHHIFISLVYYFNTHTHTHIHKYIKTFFVCMMIIVSHFHVYTCVCTFAGVFCVLLRVSND